MNTTTFETAKVGDRVWSLTGGWGEIIEIDGDPAYPITIKYDNGKRGTFTFDGYLHTTHATRNLFWGEVKIEAPQKPLPDLEVDTKVLVWNHPNNKAKRHFSHFEDGKIYTFDNGSTSFTRLRRNSITGWSNWELAE